MTTFFEGEIIGTKHSFLTRNEAWGANEKTDIHHWSRFPAWKPLAKQAKRTDFSYRDYAQREHVFMRWKEYFLVPDHRVRTISGASFEGFYYICFNQIQGSISGVYFHAKSERFVYLSPTSYHSLTPRKQIPTARTQACRGSWLCASSRVPLVDEDSAAGA